MTTRALALVFPAAPSPRLVAAEARVRRLLAESCALHAEVERLAARVVAFEVRWALATGAALADRDRALALARRLRRVEEELQRLAAPPVATPLRAPSPPLSPPPSRRPPRPARDHPSRAEPPLPPPPDVAALEPEEVALKRLHRQLARALHPDYGADDADRAQRALWMTRVNAAYHAHDLGALERLAVEAGLPEPPPPPSAGERLARLARREVALSASCAALRSELTRLAGSEPLRRLEEEARRAGEGGDLGAETRATAEVLAASALDDALARLARIMRAAAGVPATRGAGNPFVRPSADGVTARGAPLPVSLARLAGDEPGARAEGALALLAFLGEAGGSLPEGLGSVAALELRWESLRPGLGAPPLRRALASLPRGVELGLRAQGDALAAGLQLASPQAVAAVRDALAAETPTEHARHAELRALARELLVVVGPDARCPRCAADVFALHLLRVRGLDEVHGLACPRCGELVRSYVRYGPPRGVEGLLALSRSLGLVAEVEATLGGQALAFQLPERRRQAFTVAALRRIVHALLFAPNGLPIRPTEILVVAEGRVLGARARIPGRPLELVLREGAALGAAAAAERIARGGRRRFR